MKLHCLPATTTYTVDQALDKAKQDELQDVLILGWGNDGDFVALSSRMERQDALWLAKKGEQWALGDFDDD